MTFMQAAKRGEPLVYVTATVYRDAEGQDKERAHGFIVNPDAYLQAQGYFCSRTEGQRFDYEPKTGKPGSRVSFWQNGPHTKFRELLLVGLRANVVKTREDLGLVLSEIVEREAGTFSDPNLLLPQPLRPKKKD